jgi:hypothetical protein
VLVVKADLSLLYGFWPSSKTWAKICARIQADSELTGLRVKPFGYKSPKLELPFSRIRIPDYDDIAQTFAAELAVRLRDDTVIVRYSQDGLIVQRFLAWMHNEGRGEELARIRLIVMLSCLNEGSECFRSIRAAAGFGRHLQARELTTLNADAADARRTVLKRVVNAARVGPHECFIPIYLYAGRTDKIVTRASAQSGFTNVGVLPGDHSSILDPDAAGNITVPVLKKHILETLGQARSSGVPDSSAGQPPQQCHVSIANPQGVQIGDQNILFLEPGKRPERPEE